MHWTESVGETRQLIPAVCADWWDACNQHRWLVWRKGNVAVDAPLLVRCSQVCTHCASSRLGLTLFKSITIRIIRLFLVMSSTLVLLHTFEAHYFLAFFFLFFSVRLAVTARAPKNKRFRRSDWRLSANLTSCIVLFTFMELLRCKQLSI